MVPGWRQKSRCFLPSWGISSSSTITFQLAAAALLLLVVVSSIACGIRLSSIINYYPLYMMHMALSVVDHLSILPACFFNLPQESLWSGQLWWFGGRNKAIDGGERSMILLSRAIIFSASFFCLDVFSGSTWSISRLKDWCEFTLYIRFG